MKKIIYIFTILAAVSLTGCGFLDKEPDLRADINTQKKVRLLLASAYEMPNYGPMCETSSDNIIDNNTMDVSKHVNAKVPFNQMYDQMFAWDDVTSYSGQDSPYWTWENCYKNIATANQALDAIERIKAANPELNLSAERAEALLVRAYNHFVLATIFCQTYKNEEASKKDLGVHYMTAAETTVRPEYGRSNVAEVYANIKKDLEEALPYVSNDYYPVQKYHFNTKAAYAFAARVALYMRDWDKVIKYANVVLGEYPADAKAMMFDAAAAKDLGNGEQELNAWTSVASPSNLLIVTSYSYQQFMFVPSYCRYTFNRDPRDFTFGGGQVKAGPTWDTNFPGTNFWRYDANYGGFLAKIIAVWEYTDKVAGVGYAHSLRREFTSGETLLARAEAKLMKGDKAGALQDMNIWSESYLCSTLTDKNIRNCFYEGKRDYYTYPDESDETPHTHQHVPELHNQDISSDWVISDDIKPYVWCVLHFRRMETIHDGLRWFDIKRYGIEITHKIGYPAKYVTLTWDDDRRALQLPAEALMAGQEPNPRSQGTGNASLSGPTTDPSALELLTLRGEKPTITPVDVHYEEQMLND